MERSHRWIDWSLYVAAITVCLFLLAPLAIVVLNSFNSVAYSVFPPPGLSLKWYQHLGTQPQFFRAFWNSVISASGATLIALVGGTLAALAVQRHQFPGRELVRSFFMAPVVVPKIVLGVAYLILLLKLKLFGGLTGLILGHSVIVMPFVFSIITATLANVNRQQEEAASDLGARPLRVFITVTLPQMKMGLILSGAISFIFSFDQVETSIFILRPNSYTLPIEMFIYMEKWQDPTIAVISTGLVTLAMVGFFGIKLLLRSVPDVGRVLDRGEGK